MQSANRLLISIFLLASIVLVPHSSVCAETQEEKVQAISDRVMSPYCPGRTLSACPSDQARKLRREIASWYDQGYSDAAVENRLEVLFGDEVFGVPTSSPMGLVGWYMPVIFILVLLCAITLLLRKLRRESHDDIDDDELRAAKVELEALQK